MELIGKPNNKTVSDIIKSLNVNNVDKMWIATAYLNKSGFNYFKDIFNEVASIKLLVCLEPKVTDYEPLAEIKEMKSVECRFYKPNSRSYFHPKMYIIKFINGKYSVILGSSNLTYGGLTNNIEANIYYSELSYSDVKEFINFFNDTFKDAELLNAEELSEFKNVKDKYIEYQKNWLKNMHKSKNKKFVSFSLDRKLTSSQSIKIEKLLKNEKEKYVEWFKNTEHCKDRTHHMKDIEKYAVKCKWIELFNEIWSVGGLMRKYGSLGRDGISIHLANSNSSTSIQSWIKAVINEEWDEARNELDKLNDIGEKIQSELFCVFHGEKFGIRNEKSIKELEYLIGDSSNNFSYKNYGYMPYVYFNSLLNEIAQIYYDVFGQLCTSIPLMLELDAFFWYLHEKQNPK